MPTTNLLRLVLKALALFAVFNILWFVLQPMNVINRVSLYNGLVPGRVRLPFTDIPDGAYDIQIASLDQAVASHIIARPKAADEYRVVMLGDSSIWGYLLQPDQTLAARLNELNLTAPDGRKMRFYDLGYPTLTAMKDFLILRRMVQYDPDLIVWSTTLASLYPFDQIDSSVVLGHYNEVMALSAQYQIPLPELTLTSVQEKLPTWRDKTFIGQRRTIADWLRHQLVGLGWLATDADNTLKFPYRPVPTQLVDNEDLLSPGAPLLFQYPESRQFKPEDLALNILDAGINTAGQIPVIIVNEPIYRNLTHPKRINTYYPRWAYESYRAIMQENATREQWRYLDLWDVVPVDQFTDTDFHMTEAATRDYARLLADKLMPLLPR